MMFRQSFSSAERAALVAQAFSQAIGGGEWVKAHCPFCGRPGKSPALSISRSQGWYKCWRCGVRGKIEVEAREELYERPRPVEMHLPYELVPLWEYPGLRSPATKRARDYLAWRGVSLEVTEAARIGFCVTGDFAGRIIVPVFAGDTGEILGWVGRAINNAPLTYKYPKGPWRATALFNESALAVLTDEPLFVVEGVFDALALWPHAVAVLGKPSVVQEVLLARSKRPIVSVLDGDAWGEGFALAGRLSMLGVVAGSVRLPPKVDPDEVVISDLISAGRESLGLQYTIAF